MIIFPAICCMVLINLITLPNWMIFRAVNMPWSISELVSQVQHVDRWHAYYMLPYVTIPTWLGYDSCLSHVLDVSWTPAIGDAPWKLPDWGNQHQLPTSLLRDLGVPKVPGIGGFAGWNPMISRKTWRIWAQKLRNGDLNSKYRRIYIILYQHALHFRTLWILQDIAYIFAKLPMGSHKWSWQSSM